MHPGINERYVVTGVQVYVAGTESGEQGCSPNPGQMLLSLYLQGEWCQEGLETAR